MLINYLSCRIVHDIINLDNNVAQDVAFTEVRVNATEMNIHCSQVTNANIDVFTLPRGSSDFSAGNFPNTDGVINQNPNADESVWINFKMTPPPYWNPNIPGLNFTAKWDEHIIIQYGLSSKPRLYQPVELANVQFSSCHVPAMVLGRQSRFCTWTSTGCHGYRNGKSRGTSQRCVWGSGESS